MRDCAEYTNGRNAFLARDLVQPDDYDQDYYFDYDDAAIANITGEPYGDCS